MESNQLSDRIVNTILRDVAQADTVTGYREPLVGFASVSDPRFAELRVSTRGLRFGALLDLGRRPEVRVL